jgi:hypoxanthine phosphoribosyltransferase
MDSVTIHDREFTVSIHRRCIEHAVAGIAAAMNRALDGANPLFVVVLDGAFMFAADLLKRVDIPCDIAFVKLSSYRGTASTAVVRELIGLEHPVDGRTVVLVEDIIDTGRTMHAAHATLNRLQAGRVQTAALLFKPEALRHDIPIDYIGMRIPNDFVVGYGLDYNGRGRNLPDIYTLTHDRRHALGQPPRAPV